mgnify:FL=1
MEYIDNSIDAANIHFDVTTNSYKKKLKSKSSLTETAMNMLES